MIPALTASVVLGEEPDLDAISADCFSHGDGHFAQVRIGRLTIHANGDGTANLLAVIDDMKAKAEQAHTDWLRSMAEAAADRLAVTP